MCIRDRRRDYLYQAAEPAVRRSDVHLSLIHILLEEGRLTRDEVLVQRFEQLFRELGVDHSGKAISERYEVLLSCQHDFMPGAEPVSYTHLVLIQNN